MLPHIVNYDYKVRDAILDVGDKVLIRKVGLKGKQKLADKWDKHIYVVLGMPDKSVPVYRVQRKFGDSTVKTLHRNILLLFLAYQRSVHLMLFQISLLNLRLNLVKQEM